MEFTEPLEAAVVKAAQVEDPAMPKRVSLPSILPPACSAIDILTAPFCASWGVPTCSVTAMQLKATTRQRNIAIKIAIPCLLFFTAEPNVKHSAAGISRTEIISIRLVKALGFSKGCAELTPI